MAISAQRIVIHVTPEEKKVIRAKAARSSMSVSEFMRRSALFHSTAEENADLDALSEALICSTERACFAINDALAFIEQSNTRIAQMEAAAYRGSQEM